MHLVKTGNHDTIVCQQNYFLARKPIAGYALTCGIFFSKITVQNKVKYECFGN